MEWLKKQDNIDFETIDEVFLEKTLKALLSLISKIRGFNIKRDRGIYAVDEAYKLYFTIISTILLSLSFNRYFIMLNACYVVFITLLLDDEDLIKIIKISIGTLFISSLIIAPTFLFGNKNAFVLIFKIILCVSMAMIMSTTSNWHRIISSFSIIKVPNIVIFVFDTAIRFIYILSQRAYEILISFKLRSVGKINQPRKTLSQILYNLFVTSIYLSFRMDEALDCRCFNGEYSYNKYKKIGKEDVLYIIINITIIMIFFLG